MITTISGFGDWMKIKGYMFAVLNALFPLVLGLFVYLFIQKDTQIWRFFNMLFGVSFEAIVWDGFTYTFVVCWLCDILWSYALVFSLWLALRSYKNAVFISVLLAFVMGVAFELLQLFGIISGTFDLYDIILELIAAVLAAIIIKRRKTHEEN